MAGDHACYGAYLAGSTPAEIGLAYPTLSLEEASVTRACYLCHRVAIDAYLAERALSRLLFRAFARFVSFFRSPSRVS